MLHACWWLLLCQVLGVFCLLSFLFVVIFWLRYGWQSVCQQNHSQMLWLICVVLRHFVKGQILQQLDIWHLFISLSWTFSKNHFPKTFTTNKQYVEYCFVILLYLIGVLLFFCKSVTVWCDTLDSKAPRKLSVHAMVSQTFCLEFFVSYWSLCC